MQWSRKRWLAVLGVLAAVGAILAAVTQASGSPRAQVSKRSICSAGGPSKITLKARSASTIYAICEVQRGTTGPPGLTGPPGPAGRAGPAGPAGPSGAINRITVPRTAVPFSDCCKPDGGNVVPLAQVGPIHVDGLCRHTAAGPGGREAHPRYPDPNLPAAGGESEAKVIVWSETGTMSFKGMVGHRENVPPGPPDYTHEDVSAEQDHGESGVPNGTVADPVRGEGQHMFVAASNETVNEIRGTDPETNPGHESDAGIHQLPEYPFLQYSGGFIGTSEGHMVIAHMLAGMDVLGVYGECVFAGQIEPIS